MTQQAEITLAHLPAEDEHPGTLAERFLVLLDWSKTELEALEAGMYGQDAPARGLQNALWSAQFATQGEIVKAALAAGADALAIQAITWREVAR